MHTNRVYTRLSSDLLDPIGNLARDSLGQPVIYGYPSNDIKAIMQVLEDIIQQSTGQISPLPTIQQTGNDRIRLKQGSVNLYGSPIINTYPEERKFSSINQLPSTVHYWSCDRRVPYSLSERTPSVIISARDSVDRTDRSEIASQKDFCSYIPGRSSKLDILQDLISRDHCATNLFRSSTTPPASYFDLEPNLTFRAVDTYQHPRLSNRVSHSKLGISSKKIKKLVFDEPHLKEKYSHTWTKTRRQTPACLNYDFASNTYDSQSFLPMDRNPTITSSKYTLSYSEPLISFKSLNSDNHCVDITNLYDTEQITSPRKGQAPASPKKLTSIHSQRSTADKAVAWSNSIVISKDLSDLESDFKNLRPKAMSEIYSIYTDLELNADRKLTVTGVNGRLFATSRTLPMKDAAIQAGRLSRSTGIMDTKFNSRLPLYTFSQYHPIQQEEPKYIEPAQRNTIFDPNPDVSHLIASPLPTPRSSGLNTSLTRHSLSEDYISDWEFLPSSPSSWTRHSFSSDEFNDSSRLGTDIQGGDFARLSY